MKRLISVLAVAGFVATAGFCTTAVAGNGVSAQAGAHRSQLTDMTVTGTLSQESRTLKNGKTINVYVLTDATGNKIKLGHGHCKKGTSDGASAGLAGLVGQNVTLTGKGFTAQHGGKTVTRIVKVTKVEAVTAAVPSVAN